MPKNNSCFICGHEEKKEMFVANYGLIACCLGCGLVSLNSEKNEKEILKTYEKENYFDQKVNSGLTYLSYRAEKPVYLRYFKKKVDEIERVYSRGKILDVGCGLGFFLEAAREKGWEVEGVEVSKHAVSYILRNLKIRVFQGTLESQHLPGNSFDVVTLFQLVEHLVNPLQTLSEVKRLLKPGGLVVLTTPNQGSIVAKLLGRRWFQYKYQGHLYFFDQKTLKILLKKADFRDISIKGDSWQFLPLKFILSRIVYFYSVPLLEKLLKINILGRLPIPFSFDYLIATARS